jgi:hypothetical protein
MEGCTRAQLGLGLAMLSVLLSLPVTSERELRELRDKEEMFESQSGDCDIAAKLGEVGKCSFCASPN